MLIRVLRTFLGPYRKVLIVVVVLTAVQTTAALTLPTINANIIDKGIIRGDNSYIRSAGAMMLAAPKATPQGATSPAAS